MAIQLRKLWKFATTYDLLKLGKPGELAETGTEITKFALEFGLAIGLLSAVATPAGIAVAGLSGVGLAIRGVRLYREKTGKELTLEEWVAIASPFAYLENPDLSRILEMGAGRTTSRMAKSAVDSNGNRWVTAYSGRSRPLCGAVWWGMCLDGNGERAH